MIVQDVPEVIAGMEEEEEDTPGVEGMGYDFFTLQPIKGEIRSTLLPQ